MHVIDGPHAYAEEARPEVIGDHYCAARTQLYHGTEAPNPRFWRRLPSIGVHTASGIRNPEYKNLGLNLSVAF